MWRGRETTPSPALSFAYPAGAALAVAGRGPAGRFFRRRERLDADIVRGLGRVQPHHPLDLEGVEGVDELLEGAAAVVAHVKVGIELAQIVADRAQIDLVVGVLLQIAGDILPDQGLIRGPLFSVSAAAGATAVLRLTWAVSRGWLRASRSR